MKHEIIHQDFYETLPRKMDFSCVRAIHERDELKSLVTSSRMYRPACAFALPSMTDDLAKQLKDLLEVKIGGVISFPSGGDTPESKVFQARELIGKGCGELDMVMNLTFLKLERYDSLLDDIARVVNVAERIPVKIIIEASLLTEDEICRASELAVRAGAAFVKTGTGWAGPATARQVELIYQTIGDTAKIKAAGGIRTLETIKELYKAGCDRFGVGVGPANLILNELKI